MSARHLLKGLLCAALLVSKAWAQDFDQRLLDLSDRLNAANQAYEAGGGLSMDELNKLAGELEAVMREMRQIDREYGEAQRALEEEFFAESENLMKVIGFVVTFEAQPAPSYILHPDGSRASVEANIIVESIMNQLEGQLASAAQKLQNWRTIQEKQIALTTSTQTAFDDINNVRNDIIEAERKDGVERQTKDPMVLDALYAVSDNLANFVDGLDQVDMTDAEIERFSLDDHKGKLNWPVEGAPRPFRDGIKIDTDDSFVKSPVPGTVRFVAEFLDYGNLAIIEPEQNTMMVLAGMDGFTVREGDVIKAGEIIGFFDLEKTADAENKTNGEENATTSLRLPKKSLYVETRKDNLPVNVMDYFHPLEN